MSAESERESQQLQNHWSEVRYLVRCIYRQTGTPLADDQEQPLDRDKEGMKELVDRLCVKDPYQLYQRLEQQAREYVLEMKVRLLKHLSGGSKPAGHPVGPVAAAQGPPQAHQFISLLLEEYNALCQAARTISSFLLTLVGSPFAAQSACLLINTICILMVSFPPVLFYLIHSFLFFVPGE
ncbi:hypothetical protein GOODEAATRI_001991 [Goodea atripinnis]|uniref:Uncharacterized protein n=1 Tax=Goodea atripinnis TaxID=208336 RepID=A0ABV0NAE7_9TELE